MNSDNCIFNVADVAGSSNALNEFEWQANARRKCEEIYIYIIAFFQWSTSGVLIVLE